jgi:RNA recognition motif-containing protein
MAEDSRKLFVAGLPDSITEDVLRQLFEATGGSVVEVSLPKDRATGRPRGFGFVTLATMEEATSARESLDGSFQGGKSISVRPFQAEPPRRDARPGGPPSPGAPLGGGGNFGGGPAGPAGAPDRTLYVGNLPYDATVEEVEGLITATGSGPVVRVHLPMDPDGRKRGFGFVTMASADAARGAIEALRGADIRGRRLVVNLAHPKGERPAGTERSAGGYAGGGGGFAGSGFAGSTSGGGGYGGGPPAPPPPGRKTFDEKRRRGGHDGEGPPGAGGGAPGKRGGNKNSWDRGRGEDDWDE